MLSASLVILENRRAHNPPQRVRWDFPANRKPVASESIVAPSPPEAIMRAKNIVFAKPNELANTNIVKMRRAKK